MDERRSISLSHRKQIVLLSLIVLVLYALLMGEQDSAVDVLHSSGFTFVSYGERDGIRIYDLQDPDEPRQVGSYDTSGSVHSMVLVGTTLYIADGAGGLRLLEVRNPAAPVLLGSLRVPGDVLDVAILDNLAYLAVGGEGLYIVDVTYPNSPLVIGTLDTPGTANGVAVFHVTLVPPGVNDDLTPRPGIQGTYVYIAGGSEDLQVVDATVPIAPALITRAGVDGDARRVTILGNYAYVAASGGLQIFDLSVPSAPAGIFLFEETRDAQDLAFEGPFMFVASRERGVSVINTQNTVLTDAVMRFETKGSAMGLATQGNRLYIASGAEGLQVMEVEPAGSLVEIAMIEAPGEASFFQVLSGLFALVTGRGSEVQGKVWRTGGQVLFDGFLFFVVLGLWLAVFSQFTLPVRSLSERTKIISRLFGYLFGSRGQAIFIKDGAITQRTGEGRRTGPGVALLDTASAAVFRTQHAFTQVAGPGVVFTSPGEYPAGAVDLHSQAAGAGPYDWEDPFAPQGEDEGPEYFAEREERRYATSALTADGVEVVPNVGVSFRVSNSPNQGRTQFGCNTDAVWRAIAHEAVYPDAPLDSDRRCVSWAWLPVRLAIDVWREYLRKFNLDDLFGYSGVENSTDSEGERKTAYVTIVEMVNARLTKPEVPELDDAGIVIPGSSQPSKEYEILRERGIVVHGAGIRSLRIPDPVDQELLEHWEATWLQRARYEAKEVERLQAGARGAGTDTAAKEFAIGSAQQLGRVLEGNGPEKSRDHAQSGITTEVDTGTLDETQADDGGVDLERANSSGPGMRETLKLLLQGTLKLCIREHDLHPRLTNQKDSLLEMIEWVEKQ